MTNETSSNKNKKEKENSLSRHENGLLFGVSRSEENTHNFEEEGFFDDVTNILGSAKDSIVEGSGKIIDSAAEIAGNAIENIGDILSNIDIDIDL